MAREAFNNLAALVARIDRSISGLLRVGTATGRESTRLGLGNTLRVQLSSALGSPAVVSRLQDVLNRGMGGQATQAIRNAVGNYQAAMRQHQTAFGQQNALMQRMGNIRFRQQQVINASPVLSGIQAAAQARAAGMAPHHARAVMQQMVQHLAAMSPQFALYQRQLGQTVQAWTTATGAAQQAMGRAGAAAQAGRTAAMGPGGVPHGGGMTALANVIQRFGGTGMGSLVGTLFGPPGIVAGAAFDSSLKAVTKAFDMLQGTTKRANEAIDRFAIWSVGGMNAAIIRLVSEIQREIYISHKLSTNMEEFAYSQAKAINAWKEFDTVVEKFNLQVATVWEDMKSWFGTNIIGPLARQVEDDPMGGLIGILNSLPFVGQLSMAVQLLGDIFGVLSDDKKDLVNRADKYSPWERRFQDAEQRFRVAIGTGVDPLGEDFQRQLRAGAGVPAVGPANPAGGSGPLPPTPLPPLPPISPPPQPPPQPPVPQPQGPPDTTPLLQQAVQLLQSILNSLNSVFP